MTESWCNFVAYIQCDSRLSDEDAKDWLDDLADALYEKEDLPDLIVSSQKEERIRHRATVPASQISWDSFRKHVLRACEDSVPQGHSLTVRFFEEWAVWDD